MENNELEKLATNYMQIWSVGNEHLLDKFADENLVAEYTHFERAYQGILEYKSMLKMTYDFFPDLKIHLKNLIPNQTNNSVTVFWEYSGTHKNGNLFGIESSNKEVNVNGITLLEVKNGLVVKEKGIVDNLSLIMQLGVLNQ